MQPAFAFQGISQKEREREKERKRETDRKRERKKESLGDQSFDGAQVF